MFDDTITPAPEAVPTPRAVPTTEAIPCEKCAAYEENETALGIVILILAFIGPIIGMLAGMFAAKKLFGGKCK